MKFNPSVFLCLSPLLPSTYAWGTLGHQTVAYVATNFVAEETRHYFQTLLKNTTESYLAGVATVSKDLGRDTFLIGIVISYVFQS